jgi:hypothetical protein
MSLHLSAWTGASASLHVSVWIETCAVFAVLCWIMVWEWMNPLGQRGGTDFGERAWAMRHAGHGSRAEMPKTLRDRKGA